MAFPQRYSALERLALTRAMLSQRPATKLGGGNREVGFRDLRRRDHVGAGTPAIQARFSRFRSTVQQGPVQRQKTQIVQSWLTLRDFLPGFRPLPFRRGGWWKG